MASKINKKKTDTTDKRTTTSKKRNTKNILTPNERRQFELLSDTASQYYCTNSYYNQLIWVYLKKHHEQQVSLYDVFGILVKNEIDINSYDMRLYVLNYIDYLKSHNFIITKYTENGFKIIPNFWK